MDKVSYALGLSIGNNFQNSGIKRIQMEDFIRGMTDVMDGKRRILAMKKQNR
jgi:FKBP-type peptidyl-prolyl cis-trans isomerase FklB